MSSTRFDTRLTDFNRRMDAAVEVLSREYGGIRAGRATVSLLDPIKVDAYGAIMPLSQVATVGAPEPRLLTVQVWDKGMVKAVEKSIRDSDLGLNPMIEGQLLRIPLPPMTEQRRQELAKLAAKYAEDAKVSVRNVRREGMEFLKKAEKDGDISEDELHRLSDEMQTMTDEHVKKIDEMVVHKQKEIMHV
ncbi:ribosome recycling factor [Candidatus Finniella inopinata]|uniref:Ribosome-recycling factor n=1 Tax=Candidatus Finniella inopinata TaxID=1696036 RepID=A0A4Q7DIK5_9PROT|nr:ribosome recycling factor [Candidatus Finniella inopinata]RZI45935.1 ribosome recycling factor [Candidatus Finniella inopinata]